MIEFYFEACIKLSSGRPVYLVNQINGSPLIDNESCILVWNKLELTHNQCSGKPAESCKRESRLPVITSFGAVNDRNFFIIIIIIIIITSSFPFQITVKLFVYSNS